MKKLKLPADAEGAGTQLFQLDGEGNINVPDDVVQTLVDTAGFQVVPDAPEAPEGHVVLRSSIGPQSCSCQGESFTTDDNDYITVPRSMVDALLSHGFMIPPVVEVPVSDTATPEPDVTDIPLIPLGEKPADPIVEAPVEAVTETVIEAPVETPVEVVAEPVVDAPVTEPVTDPIAEPAPTAPTAE